MIITSCQTQATNARERTNPRQPRSPYSPNSGTTLARATRGPRPGAGIARSAQTHATHSVARDTVHTSAPRSPARNTNASHRLIRACGPLEYAAETRPAASIAREHAAPSGHPADHHRHAHQDGWVPPRTMNAPPTRERRRARPARRRPCAAPTARRPCRRVPLSAHVRVTARRRFAPFGGPPQNRNTGLQSKYTSTHSSNPASA